MTLCQLMKCFTVDSADHKQTKGGEKNPVHIDKEDREIRDGTQILVRVFM